MAGGAATADDEIEGAHASSIPAAAAPHPRARGSMPGLQESYADVGI